MTSAAGPLQNIYYERKVATPRACYICRRETRTVLATLKTEDYLYTCEGHLSDPGFATTITPPSTPAGPTPDDIRKVISDYEARQAKKADAKGADADKDKDKGKGKEADKDDKNPKTTSSPASSSSPAAATPSATATATATHRKFALHRQIWEMRKQEMKRKEMSSKAKEVGKGLPQVPRGNF